MDTPTPPNGAITETQRDTLREWFQALYDRHDRYDFAFCFARVLAGDKPATLLQRGTLAVSSGPFAHAADDALAFVHELGLSTEELDDDLWYCARSRDHLERLPSAESESEDSIRTMGAFFGYPEPDVEFFINTPHYERIGARERTDEFDPVELASADFCPYIHDDSIEGFERAIEAGTQIRDRIAVLAEHWELPVLDAMAVDHYELSRAVYAEEREHFPGEYIGTKIICKNPALE